MRYYKQPHGPPQVSLMVLCNAVLQVIGSDRHLTECTMTEFPFLHQLSAKEWQNLRGFIISELSPKFLQGYVAKDLGCPVLEESYFFGLANERNDTRVNVSEKLRVIIAKRDLLQNYEAHASAAEIKDEQTGEIRYKRGVQVKLAMTYFQQRWEETVRNMADLYHDPESKSLREIEFSVAASRISLEQLGASLGATPTGATVGY